jgi:hypothetical protein
MSGGQMTNDFMNNMHIIRLFIATIFSRTTLRRLLLASPILYVATCSYISENWSDKFKRIHIGDTKATVIAVFGKPTNTELPDIVYPSYGYRECQDPCVERLWYRNRLGLDEAWEFEIDKDNRVIDTGYWVSP